MTDQKAAGHEISKGATSAVASSNNGSSQRTDGTTSAVSSALGLLGQTSGVGLTSAGPFAAAGVEPTRVSPASAGPPVAPSGSAGNASVSANRTVTGGNKSGDS